MWCNLFYDKYVGDISGHGDHHYNNKITKLTTINDLSDGSYNYYSGKNALNIYNDKFKGYFALNKCAYESNLFKLMVYQKNIDSLETIYVVIGVNIYELEKIITSGYDIPHIGFLSRLCRFHLSYTEPEKLINNSQFYIVNCMAQKVAKNIEYMTTNVMKAVDYTFDTRCSDFDELNVKLYEYQKCSIYWMQQKELNKKKILYNLNEEILLGNVYYDTVTQKFNLNSNKKSMVINGGAIIDEVGVGKTLQVIGLSLLNPAKLISYKRNDIENKFVSKATLVFCPNQLCGQWIRELKSRIKVEYDPKIVSIMTKRDFDKLTYNDLLDADFVVVSFTFLDNKCFTEPWISKISDYKNFNKRIWNKTDFEVTSKVFSELGKELLSDPINSLYKKNTLIQLIHWHRFVIDEFHEIYKDNSYLSITNILPLITADNKWVVTATPFNNMDCFKQIVNFITNYKNTESEHIYSVEEIVNYLNNSCFRRNTKESVKQEHTLPPIKEEIRWLKFSPTERMIYNAYLADPNNDKFSIYLRQLCCHPQLAEETKESLSNCKTLEDIEKMMVSHYKIQVDEAQEKVNNIQERINKVNKKIKKIEKKQKKKQLKKLGLKVEDSGSDSDNSSDSEDDDLVSILMNADNNENIMSGIKPSITIENLKNKVKDLEKALTENNNILDGKTKTYNFFSNVVEKIRKTVNKETNKESKIEKNNTGADSNLNIMDIFSKEIDDDETDDEVCGICLDEIPEDNIGVTICGHIFCFDCLKMTITKFHTCPYCKKKLSDNEIYVLSYERKKKVNITKEDKTKTDLINEIGTKLANLIMYLRETNEHTIIFSQWDDLLRRVGRVLKENNIPNVFCRGNCYQRDKAIREFNDDDKIKVIMLSSDSTASGTNLTKASQVIFIDPIYGTYDYRKGQERQAIGRAHRLGQKSIIKIVRFIIMDTVEETIYKINSTEDIKYKRDFEVSNEISVN
jgi:SNF2 family DNA or RNA helicase